MTKKTYKLGGMHCTSCAMVIESDLEDVGVKAKCSYAKQSLEVELDDMVSEKTVKDVVVKAGYTLVPG